VSYPRQLKNYSLPLVYGGPPITPSNLRLLIHGTTRPWLDVGGSKCCVVNRFGNNQVSSGRINPTVNSGGLIVASDDLNDWAFGTGNFFVSFKVFRTAAVQSSIFNYTHGGATGWQVQILGTGAPTFIAGTNTYGNGDPAVNLTVPTSVETDVSFSYDGTSLRCFVNGALSWTKVVALNISASTNRLVILNESATMTAALTSYSVREVVVVKGEAVITAPYLVPDVWADDGTVLAVWNPALFTNVKLLVHGSGTNGSVVITDSSSFARTLTLVGNIQITTAQFLVSDSSINFDGTGDYATVPTSADFAFNADFSVEALIRPTAWPVDKWIYSGNDGAGDGWGMFALNFFGRNQIHWPGSTAFLDTVGNSTGITLNNWSHFAWSRRGNAMLIFINGECLNILTNTSNITSPGTLYIGRQSTISPTNDWQGQMQELRIVKGEGFKTSFKIQTAPYPNS